MKMPRSRAIFTAGHYRVLGEILATVTNPDTRRVAANHFATEFRKRYPDGFDPATWTRLTGGKVQGFDIRTGKFEKSVAIERIVQEIEVEKARPLGGYNRTYHRHNRGPA